MFAIIGWCVFGLVIGSLSRYLVPGPDPMGWLATMFLGIAGSIGGGILGSLLSGGSIGEAEPAGSIGATLTAALILIGMRRWKRSRAAIRER